MPAAKPREPKVSEAASLNKEITRPKDQIVEETRQNVPTGTEPTVKKLFVAPTVSVPEDVLEATTFFQGPTIDTSST